MNSIPEGFERCHLCDGTGVMAFYEYDEHGEMTETRVSCSLCEGTGLQRTGICPCCGQPLPNDSGATLAEEYLEGLE